MRARRDQNNSGNASSIMPLWLKSFNTVDTGTGKRYTVQQINHYVMPIQGNLVPLSLSAGGPSGLSRQIRK